MVVGPLHLIPLRYALQRTQLRPQPVQFRLPLLLQDRFLKPRFARFILC
jgi:hypothetical protein